VRQFECLQQHAGRSQSVSLVSEDGQPCPVAELVDEFADWLTGVTWGRLWRAQRGSWPLARSQGHFRFPMHRAARS